MILSELRTINIPIVQTRKLRLREVQRFAQGHSADNRARLQHLITLPYTSHTKIFVQFNTKTAYFMFIIALQIVFFSFIRLFLCGPTVQLVESQFPDQKLNRGPGQRVLGVLSTGPPGNSRQALNVSLTTCESGYWQDPPGTEKETEAFYGEVSFSFLSIIREFESQFREV